MEYSDKPPKVEHAYNAYKKRQARRKLMGARAKAAAAVLTVVGALGAGSAIEKAMQPTPQPDSIYSGRIEIVVNDNLNVRESPINTDESQVPNTVKWDQVKEVNGVDISGHHSFDVQNVHVAHIGQNETPWITLNAKVDKGLGPQDELLYINFGQDTKEFVKIEQHGAFIHLDANLHPEENLGVVTFDQ